MGHISDGQPEKDTPGKHQNPQTTRAVQFPTPPNTKVELAARRRLTTEPATDLVLGLVNQLVLLDPRHHVAQLATDRFDLVHSVQATTGGH